MKTSKERFQANLEFGEEGEKLIGEVLTEIGYIIQPLYQYKKDKTPYLFYKFQDQLLSITAPDITVLKDGFTYFVECKHKTEWVLNYRGLKEDGSNSYETGLENRHLNDYLMIYKITKVPVEIYFIHDGNEPKGIYALHINAETIDKFTTYKYPDFRRIDTMKMNLSKHSDYPKECVMSFFRIEDLEKVI